MRISSDQKKIWEQSFRKRKIMEQEMEKRIWEFIDGHCSETEKTAILQQIAENPVLRNKYNELKSVHEMLQKCAKRMTIKNTTYSLLIIYEFKNAHRA